jgi:two-component system sensor histidine kinase PilS (NtrC family)
MAPGADRNPYPQLTELRFLLKILMIFRIATVTLILGVTIVVQLKGSQALFFAPLYTVYLLIITVYLLTIFLASVFNQVEDFRRMAIGQIAVDLFLYTVIVYLSGGYESPFPFLYIFTILWSALALPVGGYWTASLSAILYGVTVDLMYYGILSPPLSGALEMTLVQNPWDVLGRIVLHIVAFFAVAFLGHQMAKRYSTAEEALTEKTADFEKLRHLSDAVFESISSGIAVLDQGGQIRSINSSAYQILGLRISEPSDSLSSDVFGDLPITDLCRKASGGRLNRWEGSYRTRGGEERVMGLSISRLKDPEKGFVIIFQDLTEFRGLEDKLQSAEKLSALGRMAASIAHEVRNPLASMSGSVQILKDSLALQGDDRRLMDIVLEETRRLNHLVGNFLDYARPPVPQFEDVDLRTVVLETVHFLSSSADMDDVQLESSVPDEPVILSVDPSQMRQILINMIKNSAEAVNGAGKVVLGLDLERGDVGPRTVLTVSDGGKGIPGDILPEIFEPFKTTKEKGTGLGLAIVYQLVQNHQGTIDVETQEGKGTTFSIYLPQWRSA